MENVGTEELQQLLNYYKQRSVDLEFQLLHLQIRYNKLLSQQNTIPATKLTPNKANKTKE